MEILIGGTPRQIRCDMNVIEQLMDEFGDLKALFERKTIHAAKFMAAAMINEHNYAAGIPERVDEERIGAEMTMEEYTAAWMGCLKCLTECIAPKKK